MSGCRCADHGAGWTLACLLLGARARAPSSGLAGTCCTLRSPGLEAMRLRHRRTRPHQVDVRDASNAWVRPRWEPIHISMEWVRYTVAVHRQAALATISMVPPTRPLRSHHRLVVSHSVYPLHSLTTTWAVAIVMGRVGNTYLDVEVRGPVGSAVLPTNVDCTQLGETRLNSWQQWQPQTR